MSEFGVTIVIFPFLNLVFIVRLRITIGQLHSGQGRSSSELGHALPLDHTRGFCGCHEMSNIVLHAKMVVKEMHG